MSFTSSARQDLLLVVDDDPDILGTLGLCLSSENYRVLLARDGVEALSMLEQALANNEGPAAILLDLSMPVMDGWHFMAEVRARKLEMPPVLLLSADPGIERHTRELHASGYVAKPFVLQDLIAQVQAIVGDGVQRR